MIDPETVEHTASVLANAAGEGSRVILFGSHARGEGGPHSDLDFLVIEPEVENRAAEAVRLRRALRGILAPIDVVVVSEGHVREWGSVRGTLIHRALTEGRPFNA